MNKLYLAGIIESVANCEKMALTIFVQGCPHKCEGCHNKHTWSGRGVCCDVDDIVKRLRSSPYLRGLTVSGGEPFGQPEGLLELVTKAKEQGFIVWVYTGYLFNDLLNNSLNRSILSQIDVLVDGKFDVNLKDGGNKYFGSSNQRIIDVQKSLLNEKIELRGDLYE